MRKPQNKKAAGGFVLSAEHVTVNYDGSSGPVTAVSDSSIHVAPGEAVGIVGESGSGKTTLASACLGMLGRRGHIKGSVQLVGQEITDLSPKQWEAVRGARVGYVGQDPFGALNPVLRVERHMKEALRRQPASRVPQLTRELLQAVELTPETASAYPHELSGGMRQRVSIAMAIANSPELLIADEPTTALDVTTQADVLALLAGLRQRIGMAILLISHDLGVVRDVCDRVYVMYQGSVVEHGPVASVMSNPTHPYTQALLRCARLDRDESGAFFDGGRRSGGREAWDTSNPRSEQLNMASVGPGHYVAQPTGPIGEGGERR